MVIINWLGKFAERIALLIAFDVCEMWIIYMALIKFYRGRIFYLGSRPDRRTERRLPCNYCAPIPIMHRRPNAVAHSLYFHFNILYMPASPINPLHPSRYFITITEIKALIIRVTLIMKADAEIIELFLFHVSAWSTRYAKYGNIYIVAGMRL